MHIISIHLNSSNKSPFTAFSFRIVHIVDWYPTILAMGGTCPTSECVYSYRINNHVASIRAIKDQLANGYEYSTAQFAQTKVNGKRLPDQGCALVSKFPAFRYFSTFSAMSKQVSYQIFHLYLTCVAAAQLQWHLSNINVVKKTSQNFAIMLSEKITNGASVTLSPDMQR